MSLIEPLPSLRVICTLGMHRSGASALSRILHLLGVRGCNGMMLTDLDDDNPKGRWEHDPLSRINDEILERFGGRWDDPPVFPSSWESAPGLADLRENARRLLTGSFAAAPLWGWSDPRTCLTLPFWQNLVGSMRYILCVRDPAAVLASLSLRNSISPAKSERLWLTHVQSSLAHTSGQKRLLVLYEDMVEDWSSELRRIAAFIGAPERADDPAVRESVAELFEQDLCRDQVSIKELAGSHHVSFAATGLYLALTGHARRGVRADDECRGRCRGRIVQKTIELAASRALDSFDDSIMLAARNATLEHANLSQAMTIAALEADRDRLKGEAAAMRADLDRLAVKAAVLTAETVALTARSGELAAREQRLVQTMARADAELRRAVATRDDQQQEHAAAEERLVRANAKLEFELRAISAAHDHQSQQRETAEQVLQEIRTSFAWRLAAAGRQLIVDYLPAGTRRRQAFHSLLRRVSPHPNVAIQSSGANGSSTVDNRAPCTGTTAGDEEPGWRTRPRTASGVDAVTFVLCIENNAIREQALLLCESIRRFGGRHRHARILAVAPRPGGGIDGEARGRLDTLGVEYVEEPLNQVCPEYGSANRVFTAAWAEEHAHSEWIVVLDSDTVLLEELALPADADVAVRPIDSKGSASEGPEDPFDAYWTQLAAIKGMPLERLPFVRTTDRRHRVRASYNGGLVVVRREQHILRTWADLFSRSVTAGLRPWRGSNTNVFASTGWVGEKASEYWGSNQAAASLAIWSTTTRVSLYPDSYNVPLHLLTAEPELTAGRRQVPPVHVHYHWLFTEPYYQNALITLRALGGGTEQLQWLAKRLPLQA